MLPAALPAPRQGTRLLLTCLCCSSFEGPPSRRASPVAGAFPSPAPVEGLQTGLFEGPPTACISPWPSLPR